MSAGTLTLTNNSAAVGGSGTAFTTEIAAGDFIVVTVGGVPYTLPIKTINSNASLTLVSNYTGPTQSGAAWYAVPRVAMNLVTAALVAQSAEALRGLNYDKQNWQSIYSGTGAVTVKLPDGSSWTGPAWNSITTSLSEKLAKSQNLADLTDKPAALTNLGAAAASSPSFKGNGQIEGSFTGGAGAGVAVAAVAGSTKNKVEMNNRTASSSNGAYMGWSAYYYIDEYVLAGIRRGPATAIYSYAINFNGTSAFEFLASGNAIAPGTWTSNSDLRIKENIERIADPLEKMKLLSGCTWERKDGMGPGIGFIAQEVQSVFPFAVYESGDRKLKNGTTVENVLSVDVSGVAAALHHEAILALIDKVQALEHTIMTLKV